MRYIYTYIYEHTLVIYIHIYMNTHSICVIYIHIYMNTHSLTRSLSLVRARSHTCARALSLSIAARALKMRKARLEMYIAIYTRYTNKRDLHTQPKETYKHNQKRPTNTDKRVPQYKQKRHTYLYHNYIIHHLTHLYTRCTNKRDLHTQPKETYKHKQTRPTNTDKSV